MIHFGEFLAFVYYLRNERKKLRTEILRRGAFAALARNIVRS